MIAALQGRSQGSETAAASLRAMLSLTASVTQLMTPNKAVNVLAGNGTATFSFGLLPGGPLLVSPSPLAELVHFVVPVHSCRPCLVASFPC